MHYDPDKHHRRSLRIQGYDYTRAGAYFITICSRNRECLLGEIVDGTMRLNAVGQIVHEEWLRSARIREEIELDRFVVMPNHIHGIIIVNGNGVGATRRVAPTNPPHGPAPKSIGAIIGQFKSAATKRINALQGTPGSPVWQRNYYEHIVRNEDKLNRTRQYIIDNPANWEMDENNMSNGG